MTIDTTTADVIVMAIGGASASVVVTDGIMIALVFVNIFVFSPCRPSGRRA